MAQIIPTQSVPNQTLDIGLNGQNCTITIWSKSTGTFVDLYVNNALIIGGVLCEDRNRIVRSLYLGFAGDLAWFDTQGTDDPAYTGFGTRWQLVYLLPSELPAGQG